MTEMRFIDKVNMLLNREGVRHTTYEELESLFLLSEYEDGFIEEGEIVYMALIIMASRLREIEKECVQ